MITYHSYSNAGKVQILTNLLKARFHVLIICLIGILFKHAAREIIRQRR